MKRLKSNGAIFFNILSSWKRENPPKKTKTFDQGIVSNRQPYIFELETTQYCVSASKWKAFCEQYNTNYI